MQTIKKALNVLIRLTLIDGIILIMSWVENIAFGTRKYLSKYAINSTGPDFASMQDVYIKIEEIREDVYIVQTEQERRLGEQVRNLSTQVKRLITDMYEIEEEGDVLPISSEVVLQ